MPSRKDSTSRRLFNLFQHATWQHAEQIAEQRLSDMLARIGGRINFADDIAHAAFSREALMLEESSERDRSTDDDRVETNVSDEARRASPTAKFV
jgi:hypothetical protein